MTEDYTFKGRIRSNVKDVWRLPEMLKDITQDQIVESITERIVGTVELEIELIKSDLEKGIYTESHIKSANRVLEQLKRKLHEKA